MEGPILIPGSLKLVVRETDGVKCTKIKDGSPNPLLVNLLGYLKKYYNYLIVE